MLIEDRLYRIRSKDGHIETIGIYKGRHGIPLPDSNSDDKEQYFHIFLKVAENTTRNEISGSTKAVCCDNWKDYWIIEKFPEENLPLYINADVVFPSFHIALKNA